MTRLLICVGLLSACSSVVYNVNDTSDDSDDSTQDAGAEVSAPSRCFIGVCEDLFEAGYARAYMHEGE